MKTTIKGHALVYFIVEGVYNDVGNKMEATAEATTKDTPPL